MIERSPLCPPWLPPLAHAHDPEVEDDVVHDHDQRLGGRASRCGEEPPDRGPATVHEGERLHQKHGLAAHHRLGHPGLVLLVARGAGRACDQRVDHHETDVVPRPPITRPRVAEADDEPQLLLLLLLFAGFSLLGLALGLGLDLALLDDLGLARGFRSGHGFDAGPRLPRRAAPPRARPRRRARSAP